MSNIDKDIHSLEHMISQMIVEQQVKLGYVKETVRLYLPSSTLEGILQTSELKEPLGRFCKVVQGRLGKVEITRQGQRYCIAIPPEGGAYIHKYVKPTAFLVELIERFRHHGISISDVTDLFEKFSPDYVCEKQSGEEFDYLLYFRDKTIDEYFYLVKFDGEHASYHRFMEHDVKDLLF